MNTVSRPDRRPFEARLLSSLDRLQRFVAGRHGAVQADDIVQETLLRAWKGRASFDESKELWPWLRTVAGHAAARRSEVEARLGTECADLDSIQGEASGGAASASEETQAILARLQGDERDVVDRFYLQGATVREIARERSCPEGTVKSQLSRARKRLAQLLGVLGVLALALWILPWRAASPDRAAVLHSHTMGIEVQLPEPPRLLRRDLTGAEDASAAPTWTVSNARFVRADVLAVPDPLSAFPRTTAFRSNR